VSLLLLLLLIPVTTYTYSFHRLHCFLIGGTFELNLDSLSLFYNLTSNIKPAFIPLWILPSSFAGLSAGAFFIQFGVQGAWGVVRIFFSSFFSSSPSRFVFTFRFTFRSTLNDTLDPNPTSRNVASRIQSYVPWCGLSNRKRMFLSFFFLSFFNFVFGSV